jgi:ribonuclease HI
MKVTRTIMTHSNEANDKTITIFTDGACRGNQNSSNEGGWGAVLTYKSNEKCLCGYESNTTNNRMEIKSVIEALKTIKSKDYDIVIYSDSSYLVNCFKEGWYRKWLVNGWINSKKDPVENKDLWVELIDLIDGFRNVTFFKIKGHLDIGKESELKKWHKKVDDSNNMKTSMDRFKYLVSMNHKADELANMAIDDKQKTG